MSAEAALAEPAAPAARPRAARELVASLPPPVGDNPYQRLLYDALAREGIDLVGDAALELGWLLRRRGSVRYLHVHWPEGLYELDRGPARLQGPLSWAKLAAFAARLAAARSLGYRIAWTVHQLYPHESRSARRDALAARVLARAAHVLVAHDEPTAGRVRSALGPAAPRVHVVPHGSYVGVYPPGRPRRAVRKELQVGPETFVFLAFGELRGYKNLELALDAFAAADLRDAAFAIAGRPKDRRLAEWLGERARSDPRIRVLPRFVPAGGVAELFDAVDAVVATRADGGTSGSLILALSLAKPVVAPAAPAYTALTGRGAAGWHFGASAESLRLALEAAATAPPFTLARKGSAALALAESLRWSDSARRLAALLRGEA